MTKNKRFKMTETELIFMVLDNENPLSRKEIVDKLNDFNDENEELKQQLQKIQDSFEVNITQNREEFNKDKLYIKDTNTKLHLNNGNLFIEVYIPQINEYYRFKYKVTGRSAMREFIEKERKEIFMKDKQVTGVWCSETGEIGFTENGIINNLIKDNKELTETVGFADRLIRHHCDEEGMKMWDKFNELMWEEYKKRVRWNE